MPTRIEVPAAWLSILILFVAGCGDPSEREVKNARSFEALLTAVSLRNPKELEADARVIETRHKDGELSDSNYKLILEVIEKARAGDWVEAEKRAYSFRKQFGDSGAYFR